MSMFDTVMILDALERLRDACHRNSKDHGFWDEGEQNALHDGCMGVQEVTVKTRPWSFGEKVALIHSELSEMLEAWRKGTGPCDKDISITGTDGTRRITAVEEELADVLIRLMDLAGKLNIDVGRVVLAKMEYNKGRPYKHGGRAC